MMGIPTTLQDDGAATDRPAEPSVRLPLPRPSKRRLRVYAFDPNASLDLGSTRFGHATVELGWYDPTEEPVSPGPVNEYLEVIDIDPTSGQFYEPLDLDAPEVLGQDGLPPSEGDPRFHQQMVFAVAMKTIRLFERALGRKVLWAPVWDDEKKTYQPTMKLRIYPHALREANAYYSKTKRALLFGYFNTRDRRAGASWIFTALSHDIIVHETTHAILDGLHPRYSEPTSVDSLAFHEAFADITALFSHFQLREAVEAFIARDGGRLDQRGLLSALAGQFAQGTVGRAALREFIDTQPDPERLETATEPHDRGAMLVAAVFDAFLSIYTARTVDLLRLSGTAPAQGSQLHPDLVRRLAAEATKSADHVLRMCIRALDYLPPVDVRFGEFLRAIVTADTDLIPDDRLHYRLAFVEAFRRRGIFPADCLSLSPDNLLWESPSPIPGSSDYLPVDDIEHAALNLLPEYGRKDIVKTAEENRRKVWYWLLEPEFVHLDERAGAKEAVRERFMRLRARMRALISSDYACRDGRANGAIALLHDDLRWIGLDEDQLARLADELSSATTHFARWQHFISCLKAAKRVRQDRDVDAAWERALGIFFQRPAEPGHLATIAGDQDGLRVQVASVRTTRRSGPDGQDIRQLVIEITQKRQGYLDPEAQRLEDKKKVYASSRPKTGDFVFRGGATLIVDLRDKRLRYVIRKNIDSEERLEQQRKHLLDPAASGFTYDRGRSAEPFALLHRH